MKHFFILAAALFMQPLSLQAQETPQTLKDDTITYEQAKQKALAISNKCHEEAFAGQDDERVEMTFEEEITQGFAFLTGKPAPDIDVLGRDENLNICLKNKMIEITEKHFAKDENKKKELIEIINNYYNAMTAFYAEVLPRSADVLGFMDYRSLAGSQREKLEENLAELILYTNGGLF